MNIPHCPVTKEEIFQSDMGSAGAAGSSEPHLGDHHGVGDREAEVLRKAFGDGGFIVVSLVIKCNSCLV